MREQRSLVTGLRNSIIEAVQAAVERNPDRFELAAAGLAGQDPERLALVQAWMLRSLLERAHPDGLAGADAQDVLRRTLRSAEGWYSESDPAVLALVLTGALGLADPDQPAPASRSVLSAQASLLIAELLVAVAGLPVGGTGSPAGGTGSPVGGTGSHAGGTVVSYVDGALAELRRAETIEMP
jgi:hypothetical protein